MLISSNASVRRWRLAPADSDKERQPAGHKDEAWSLAFSPDGRTVATGSDDSEPDPTIKLWDTATGQLNTAWPGGKGTVASLAFSPDGRTLASGHLVAKDNVRIWDAATGQRMATLNGHTDRVRAWLSLAMARAWQPRAPTALSGSGTSPPGASARCSMAMATRCTPWLFTRWQDARLRRQRGRHPALESAIEFDVEPALVCCDNRANLMAIAFAPDGKTLAVADSSAR